MSRASQEWGLEQSPASGYITEQKGVLISRLLPVLEDEDVHWLSSCVEAVLIYRMASSGLLRRVALVGLGRRGCSVALQSC
jgi:hypothetical protein